MGDRLATIDMGLKLGERVPFWGAQSPSNTKSPVSRPTSIPSGILTIQPFRHNGYGPKIEGCVPFEEGSWVPIEHKVVLTEVYFRTKWHFDPPSRLAAIDICLKIGELCPFGGSWVPS